MNLQITVTISEFLQAAENLSYFIIKDQNLNRNVEINENAFAKGAAKLTAEIIKHHLENKIDNILSNPEDYLDSDEMSEVEKFISMPYSEYLKMMDRDIPYPA
jgi:hypothetical protein